METRITATLKHQWMVSLSVSVALFGLATWSRPAAAGTINPARSLFVTDRAVLDSGTGTLFSLERVFDQLVAQSRVPTLTAQTLWSQWWDTFNPRPGLGLGSHCDSHLTPDGQPGIKDFPIACPRQEGNEATVSPFDPTGEVFYQTVALVNRFDLAPLTGESCGEYRMVFARASLVPGGRNFLIFEAVLPNPTPSLGLEGCRPVAEFWANLSAIDDAAARATALADFYFTGLPGFPPVVEIDHYVSGQIRTNMFIEPLWQLREFKLVHPCGDHQGPCAALRFRLVTDKSNPFGALFDDTATSPKAVKFRARFLKLLPGLLADDLMGIALPTPNRFNAGQSNSQGVENDYAFQFLQGSGSFGQAIQQELTALGSDLTPPQIVNRALTQSCAGCHRLSTFAPNRDLGHGLVWPASNGFVHVDEGGNLSPALRDVFLPHRQAVLEGFLSGVSMFAASAHGVGPEVSTELTIGGPRRPH